MGTRVVMLDAGRIVQVGTPEDIALRPATGYVREFAAGLNPLAVLRAASVMRPVAPCPGMPLAVDGHRIPLDAEGRPGPGVPAVRASAPRRDVVAARALTDKPVVVVSDDGRVVGIVDEREILQALVRGGGTPQASAIPRS